MKLETAEKIYELVNDKKLIEVLIKNSNINTYFEKTLQEINKQIEELEC